jgi:hypothetical protein
MPIQNQQDRPGSLCPSGGLAADFLLWYLHEHTSCCECTVIHQSKKGNTVIIMKEIKWGNNAH